MEEKTRERRPSFYERFSLNEVMLDPEIVHVCKTDKTYYDQLDDWRTDLPYYEEDLSCGLFYRRGIRYSLGPKKILIPGGMMTDDENNHVYDPRLLPNHFKMNLTRKVINHYLIGYFTDKKVDVPIFEVYRMLRNFSACVELDLANELEGKRDRLYYSFKVFQPTDDMMEELRMMLD